MGKISNLSLNEAIKKGYTQKDWERARKISDSLKKYWSIKPRLIREKKPIKKRVIIKRIRRQLVQNYKLYDTPPYFASIRAITINNQITDNGLKLALMQGKKMAERDLNFKFSRYYADYTAIEKTEIGHNEEKSLNDYKVHIQVFLAYLNGRKNIETIYII